MESMTVPRVPELEQFIQGCQLVLQQPVGPGEQLAPRTDLLSSAPMEAIWIKYPIAGLAVDSAVGIVDRSLRKAGLDSDSDIAKIFIGLIVGAMVPGRSAIDFANQVLGQVVDAELWQVVVLPVGAEEDYSVKIGRFYIGPFDPSQLLYWAKRGGSRFAFDLNRLTSKVSLHRERFTTRVVPWMNLRDGFGRIQRKFGLPTASAVFVDEYFQSVFKYHLEQVPERLQRETAILEAGSLLAINERSFLNEMFATTIGLFSWRFAGKMNTWALMSSKSGIRLNLPPAAIFKSCNEWLASELGFEGLSSDKPLDRAIESYCEFLQRAVRHSERGAWDEAFLHFIIALDLLLGLGEKTTQTLAERAALLVCRQLGKGFEEQVKAIRQLYGKRSKYVHEGMHVDEGDLAAIESITRELLWCLLVVSGANVFTDVDALLNQVDFLISAIRANRAVSEDDLESVGVPALIGKRNPPNTIDHRRRRGQTWIF